MKPKTSQPRIWLLSWWLTLAATGAVADPNLPSLKAGDTFEWSGRRATVKRLEDLPHVESDYTRRFKFDTAENPKLAELRRQYHLDEVVAQGRDEFDRQVRLLDWVHHRFKKFGRPTSDARGALEILKAVEDGQTFFCSQYAHVFTSAAASLGWVDRVLALRRHQDSPGSGSSEHSTTEIWSNQYRKWVMMDPTAMMYLEMDGVPLNAFEIRQEWFYQAGRKLVFVVGKERRRYRKSDLPLFLAHFPGFGDLTVPADELDKYGFIAYIPNTNLMDSGLDYAGMFIVKDSLCEGTPWHTRTVPTRPAEDPYFPIGQVALRLEAGANRLQATLLTMTPNLQGFETRFDDGLWTSSSERFLWTIRPGANRLEARTRNRFGVVGPSSFAEVEW